MAVNELVPAQTGDFDLTTIQEVFNATPSVTLNLLCVGYIKIGIGAKNLDPVGGDWLLSIEVDGQMIQPAPQTITFGGNLFAAVFTAVFPVPANSLVKFFLTSPNAADIDVTVEAYLFDAQSLALPDIAPGLENGLPLLDAALRVSSNVTLMATDVLTADAVADDAGQEIASWVDVEPELIPYFQLILREDTAIKTDQAATLALINANEGSGAGVYDNVLASQEAIISTGNADWITGTGLGTGARLLDITVDDGTNPLLNAVVRISNAITLESFVGLTDVNGLIQFSANDGTWTVSITFTNHIFTPVELVVADNVTITYTMTPDLPPLPPADPSLVNVLMLTVSENGVPEATVTVEAYIHKRPVDDVGIAYDKQVLTAVSDAEGDVVLVLVRGAEYMIRRGLEGGWSIAVIPLTGDNIFIPSLIGLDA